MSKDIISKIKELAYENVNKKIEEERKETERKISQEIDDVKKCLTLIENKLVYKKITINWNIQGYKLANEEMFFTDYNTDSKYYKGIKFPDENNNDDYVFRVNGEYYYDVRSMIKYYERDFKKYDQEVTRISQQFYELKKGYEELKSQETYVKDLIKQLEKVKEDE